MMNFIVSVYYIFFFDFKIVCVFKVNSSLLDDKFLNLMIKKEFSNVFDGFI